MAHPLKKLLLSCLLVMFLLPLLPAQTKAEAKEEKDTDLIAAAFELLEAGNPFTARYEKLTGKTITPLFPDGVPYFFGGQSGTKFGDGYFYFYYPYYCVKVCEKGSNYFKVGSSYLYGLDCIGFTRHVYKACGKKSHPSLSDLLTHWWDYRNNLIYTHREGHQAPPFDQLKDVLQIGDLYVVRHDTTKTNHVMMYIGTLRDFGYTAEEEPALAPWLDWPLVIHCGLSPFCGERFQKVIDSDPERYAGCITTDGGVAVSLIGLSPEDAPEHGHVQNTDYSWFTMNDGGYMLTVVNLTDVKTYSWYRQ